MDIVPSVRAIPDPDLLACRRCVLAETRTQVVPGGGPVPAAVMAVGEAPGRSEDKTGVGFQGAAGRWFDDALAALGLERGAIWLTNAVRCRPVEGRRNRAPRPEELARCRMWLEKDLERVNPQVILTLGKVAYRALTGDEVSAMGQAIEWQGRLVFPLYHPAYCIYRPDIRNLYFQHLLELGAFLDARGIPRTPRPGRFNDPEAGRA